MAGESSIDTGINVGEAQVFRPYNDQGLTGQAEIGIEQDKLNRKATAQKEKEKQLKDSLLEFKGDGIVPALSNVATKKYKNLNEFATASIQKGLYNDYDFNNRINGEKAVFAQFLSDSKEYSKDLAAIQKLSLEGKLDDESQKIFDEMLMNPKPWDDMQAKGASEAEISGAYSAALKSVKEKPAIEDWTKKIPRTLDFTGKSSIEDPTTGKTVSSNYFNKDLARKRAKQEIKTLTPGEYAKAMLDFGSPENFENYLVETWKTNFNPDSSVRFGGDQYDDGLGGNILKVGGLLTKVDLYEDPSKTNVDVEGYLKSKDPLKSMFITEGGRMSPTQPEAYVNPVENIKARVNVEAPTFGSEGKKNKFISSSGREFIGVVKALDNKNGRNIIISTKDGEEEVPYAGNEVAVSDALKNKEYDSYFNATLRAHAKRAGINLVDGEQVPQVNPTQGSQTGKIKVW